MNKDKEKILETIKKALLLAKDQKGTPEGDNAKSHACRLMAKYRISETEIDMETDNFIMDQFRFDHDNNNCPQWVGRIIWMFCETFGTKHVYRESWNYNEYDIIGTFSDVETVMYFVEVVTNHIEKACWRTWPNKKNWRKRQQCGNEAATVIWSRLYEIKNEMDKTIHEDESCSALVVQKENEIMDSIKEMYPHLKSGPKQKLDLATDAKTRNAGQKAGKECPLSFGIEN